MRRALAAAAVLSSIAAASSPEVVDVSASGFLVRHEVVVVAATPEKVYRTLTAGVGSWWHPDHTRSKDPKNLSIDLRPGGCFCEKLADAGELEHLRVVYVAPGRLLRMSGALGPLQESGLAGSLTWTLAPDGSTTKVELTYSIGGYFRGGFEKIAPAVDRVLGEQIARLKTFVESGRPTAK